MNVELGSAEAELKRLQDRIPTVEHDAFNGFANPRQGNYPRFDPSIRYCVARLENMPEFKNPELGSDLAWEIFKLAILNRAAWVKGESYEEYKVPENMVEEVRVLREQMKKAIPPKTHSVASLSTDMLIQHLAAIHLAQRAARGPTHAIFHMLLDVPADLYEIDNLNSNLNTAAREIAAELLEKRLMPLLERQRNGEIFLHPEETYLKWMDGIKLASPAFAAKVRELATRQSRALQAMATLGAFNMETALAKMERGTQPELVYRFQGLVIDAALADRVRKIQAMLSESQAHNVIADLLRMNVPRSLLQNKDVSRDLLEKLKQTFKEADDEENFWHDKPFIASAIIDAEVYRRMAVEYLPFLRDVLTVMEAFHGRGQIKTLPQSYYDIEERVEVLSEIEYLCFKFEVRNRWYDILPKLEEIVHIAAHLGFTKREDPEPSDPWAIDRKPLFWRINDIQDRVAPRIQATLTKLCLNEWPGEEEENDDGGSGGLPPPLPVA
jgi:hypothetical protein